MLPRSGIQVNGHFDILLYFIETLSSTQYTHIHKTIY